MCGISGIFGRGDRETLRAMLHALRHRGPDDQFDVVGNDFSLGATRLSIVDVAGGRQPMSNETGRIWAAQNGELYNFPQLRPSLLARGHTLRTQCDTESLPHLYEEFGANLPKHLDGMFALAVWDDERKVGLLSRDRMGKKPLYYSLQGSALYFASEIKALLVIPGFKKTLNLEALRHYLSYKHVPHPRSIFAGIRVLPPAHSLIFRPGQMPVVQRYWDVEFRADDVNVSETELVDQLLDLLRQGVQRRLMADVPIGFFLSGGLDSALVTALAAEISPRQIKTFTLAYSDGSTTPGKDADRRWARWVADRCHTEHHEETVACGDFPANLRRILAAFDEPFCGVTSTYFLAQLISRHVKVALAGDGADELFGSYLSHRLAQPLVNYSRYLRDNNSELIRPFDSQPDYLAKFHSADPAQWRSQLFVFSEAEKQQLFHPDFQPLLNTSDSEAHFSDVFRTLVSRDPLNRVLEGEFRSIFPDQVLTFVDRLSMAHSLEVRCPFLDTDFVQFAASLPAPFKIRRGETKYLLKQAALRYFPAEMVFRPKEGFIMPVGGWLLGSLEPYVRDTLAAGRLARHGLFAAEYVEGLIADFYAGQHAHANKILSLITFQEWFDLYQPTIPDRMADATECAAMPAGKQVSCSI